MPLIYHLNVKRTTDTERVYQALSNGRWYGYAVCTLPDGREIIKAQAPNWHKYIDNVEAAIAWLQELHDTHQSNIDYAAK